MTSSKDTFIEEATTIDRLLTEVNDMYTNTYSRQVSGSGNSHTQLGELDNEVVSLKAKLERLKTVSDTYDREYLDRMEEKPLGGFWRSRGVSTLQDWVLLSFFALYTFITIGLIILAVMNVTYPLMYVVFISLISCVTGIMIAAVLVRFG
jgi:hypothetical protein